MLKKITLVTFFISNGAFSAELIQNNNVVIEKLEAEKIQEIALEKIQYFKCSPYPLCGDYPDDDDSDSDRKIAVGKSVLVNKLK